MLHTALANLRNTDPRFLLPGADFHRYRLAPALSAARAAELEAEYGIRLPADYRGFVTGVGNGGAGPGYGVERFLCLANKAAKPRASRWEQRRKVVLGVETKRRIDFDDAGNEIDPFDLMYFDSAAGYAADGELGRACLMRRFPLSEPFRSISDEMWDVQIPNWNAEIQAAHRVNRERFAAIGPSDGAMRIAHYGSGIYAMIVLNGPFFGQIWIYDPNMGDYVPASMRTDLHDQTIKVENAYRLHQEPPGFDGWYGHWLESSRREIQREYAQDKEAREKSGDVPKETGTGPLRASGEADGLRWELYDPPGE